MNLMISGGRGEDHHSLLLTIKIRLASTVSTLASVKAWQGREGGQPPRGCLRVCHVNYGDPTVPFTDCSGLKEIHNPFLLASTVTDSISTPSFLYFGNLLLLFLLPYLIKTWKLQGLWNRTKILTLFVSNGALLLHLLFFFAVFSLSLIQTSSSWCARVWCLLTSVFITLIIYLCWFYMYLNEKNNKDKEIKDRI